MIGTVFTAPFRLLWSADGWKSANNAESDATGAEIHFVDRPISRRPKAPVRFTFYWPKEARWEGKDFGVDVVAPNGAD